jgi:hypothetical protein
MNPYDLYYLHDFLKFSPFSPNHANLNNVQAMPRAVNDSAWKAE